MKLTSKILEVVVNLIRPIGKYFLRNISTKQYKILWAKETITLLLTLKTRGITIKGYVHCRIENSDDNFFAVIDGFNSLKGLKIFWYLLRTENQFGLFLNENFIPDIGKLWRNTKFELDSFWIKFLFVGYWDYWFLLLFWKIKPYSTKLRIRLGNLILRIGRSNENVRGIKSMERISVSE